MADPILFMSVEERKREVERRGALRLLRASRSYAAPGMRRRLFWLLYGTRKAALRNAHPGADWWMLRYAGHRAELSKEMRR